MAMTYLVPWYSLYLIQMILSQHAFKSVLFIHNKDEKKSSYWNLSPLSHTHTKQHGGNFHLHTCPDMSGIA